MSSLEDLVAALNDTLTPPSSPLAEAHVECTASSFGITLIGNIAQKLQWTDEQIKLSDTLFTTTFFSLATVNGLVTEQVEQSDVPQLVFTTSALITYIEYLTYMLNTIPLFCTEVQKQVEFASQNQIDPNAFIQSVTALHEFAQLTQYVVVHYDNEIPLTKNAIQVPLLGEQINAVISAIIQLYNLAGAIYTDISKQIDPTYDYQTFIKLYGQVLQVIPALITMITQIKDSLSQTVTQIYPEPEYTDFQLYLKAFTKSSAMLYLLSSIIGMYNQDSFHITLSVLKILAEQLHIIDAKITRLLRFRGNFDLTVKEIRGAYQTMSEIFKPLLENLVTTLPMVPIGYRSSAEQAIVESFQHVQKSFNEFNGRFDNLLSAIRKDRRFSLFQNIDIILNSPVTTQAQNLIQACVFLSQQMLLDDASIPEISQTVQDISANYSQFLTYFNQIISDALELTDKQRWVRQRDYIALTLNDFINTFQVFSANQQNILFKWLTAAYGARFAASFLMMDLHPMITMQLQVMRSILISGIILLFKSTGQTVFDLLSHVNQISSVLSPEAKQKFDIIFHAASPMFHDAVQKILLITSEIDTETFTKFLYETDKICLIFKALISIIDGCQHQNMAAASTLLSSFENALSTLTRIFRILLQIGITNEAKSFNFIMSPYIDTLSTLFKLQSDSIYERYLKLKKPLEECLDKVKKVLDDEPPSGSFDPDFCKNIIENFGNATNSAFNLTKEIPASIKSSSYSSYIEKYTNLLSNCIQSYQANVNYQKTIIVKSKCHIYGVVGYKLKENCTSVSQKLTELVQLLQTDPQTTPSLAILIARDLYEIPVILNKESDSIQLKPKSITLNNLVTSYTCGDQTVIHKLVDTIQDLGNCVVPLIELSDQLIKQISDPQKSPQPQKEEPKQLLNSPEKEKENKPVKSDMEINYDEISDSEISDVVIEIDEDLTGIISRIVSDVKTLTQDDSEELNKELQDLKKKSIVLTLLSLTAAKRRSIMLNKHDVDNFSKEILKLIANLNDLEKISKDSLQQSSKTAPYRKAVKLQREITINISTISMFCDKFVEIPQNSDENYVTNCLSLMFLIIKQDKQKSVDVLKQFSLQQVSEKEDLDLINCKLSELEDKISAEDILTQINLVIDIKQAIDSSLSDDIKSQPEIIFKLPFRFNVTTNKSYQPRTVAEIKQDIDDCYNLHENSLNKLNEVLNSRKSTSETLFAALKEYHDSSNKLLLYTDQMRNSTWNPNCQNKLQTCYNDLVSVGDQAIDACRARLLAHEMWKETIQNFIETAKNCSQKIITASQESLDAVQQDLSSTNDAEKELVIAAQNIQKSQTRLMSFKSQAEDQRTQKGDSYIGVEIIDVSAPILNSSAKLIEAAQAQMKYCLARKPNLDNQSGMINTARNLVDSLDLIIVAAEAIVKSEVDAINKVLAACNIISSAIAHFQAECRQKEGSPELNDVIQKITDQIQETIGHVRNFGETAQRKEEEEETTQDLKQPSKVLNKMVEKLNAEAKVIEAKRALEEAENRLKQIRQKK